MSVLKVVTFIIPSNSGQDTCSQLKKSTNNDAASKTQTICNSTTSDNAFESRTKFYLKTTSLVDTYLKQDFTSERDGEIAEFTQLFNATENHFGSDFSVASSEKTIVKIAPAVRHNGDFAGVALSLPLRLSASNVPPSTFTEFGSSRHSTSYVIDTEPIPCVEDNHGVILPPRLYSTEDIQRPTLHGHENANNIQLLQGAGSQQQILNHQKSTLVPSCWTDGAQQQTQNEQVDTSEMPSLENIELPLLENIEMPLLENIWSPQHFMNWAEQQNSDFTNVFRRPPLNEQEDTNEMPVLQKACSPQKTPSPTDEMSQYPWMTDGFQQQTPNEQEDTREMPLLEKAWSPQEAENLTNEDLLQYFCSVSESEW